VSAVVNSGATETSFVRIATTVMTQSTIAVMISGFLFLVRNLMRLSDMFQIERIHRYCGEIKLPYSAQTV
jgi:hypothetical protein